MSASPNALVVIPTFNERDNLSPLAEQVLALGERIRILVVDDASPDGTGQVADALAADTGRVLVLHRTGKLGLGTAYCDGFAKALAETDAELICQMDADFSHDPKYLPDLWASDGDLVIGSRYVSGGGIGVWSQRRHLLSRWANFYVRVLLGIPAKDATGGFKCFRRKVLETLDLKRVSSDGYAFQVEMNYYAWKAGFSIREVPIEFGERKHGESKLSMGVIAEAARIPWRLRGREVPVSRAGQ